MTAPSWMRMADQALASARTLLDVGDTDGCCNRAYHAMFGAANAALVSAGEAPETKSHMGLLRLFGLKLIETGVLPDAFGRSLQRVQSLRHLADYHLSSVERPMAERAVAEAGAFVATVHDLLERQPDQKGEKLRSGD